MAYFPNTAVISMIATLESGEALEVGLVGREGLAGTAIFPGITMMSFAKEVVATGSDTFEIRLNKPFGLVLETLAGPENPLFITREADALGDPNTAITTAINSIHVKCKSSGCGWPISILAKTSTGATNRATWMLLPTAMFSARSILFFSATRTAVECSAALPMTATTITPTKTLFIPNL